MMHRMTRGSEDPVYHEWMDARSLYFADPDDNQLELCAQSKDATLVSPV